MNWILLAITSAILYSASNALTNIFRPKLPLGIGLLWFTGGAFLGSLLISLFVKTAHIAIKTGENAHYIAILSGFVFVFGLLFFIITLKNAPLALAIPVVVGGISVGGVLAGILVFHETLTAIQTLGIVTVLIGTVILSRG